MKELPMKIERIMFVFKKKRILYGIKWRYFNEDQMGKVVKRKKKKKKCSFFFYLNYNLLMQCIIAVILLLLVGRKC